MMAWWWLASLGWASDGSVRVGNDDPRLAELEQELPGRLVPVEPGVVLVITRGVYLLQPEPAETSDDPPAVAPAVTSVVEPVAPPEPVDDSRHGTVRFELRGNLVRLVEVTCDDGYRQRSHLVDGVARIPGVPTDPSLACRASLKHATRLHRMPVVGGRSYACTGAAGLLQCRDAETRP